MNADEFDESAFLYELLLGDACRHLRGAGRGGGVLGLDRDPQDRLGAGRPDEETARRSERCFGASLCGAEGLVLFPLAAPRGLHVARHLWPELHFIGELREGASLGAHEVQDFERGEDAIARCRVLTKDHVSRPFPAKLSPESLHGFPDVSIPDLGTLEPDTVTSEHGLEATVRHDRADHDLRVQLAVAREVARDERKDKVAVVRATALVDDDDAVAVAIECETRVGLVIDDEPL